MKSLSFNAMGTSWWLSCDTPGLLDEAKRLVHDAESQLSRFRPDSALSALNRDRVVDHPLLADVVRVSLRFRELTGGAFDPRLGARLAELGYDRTFVDIGRPSAPVEYAGMPSLEVHVVGSQVRLSGEGRLDLGGVAKGFTIDLVLDRLLEGGANEALVDGGGDIRGVGGPWSIGVGDGLVVDTDAGAVATSSTRARTWQAADGSNYHHLLDPSTGLSADTGLNEAVVVARDATTADALATSLLIDPHRVLPTLERIGAHAIVRASNGSWWTTPSFPFARRKSSNTLASSELRHD